MFIHVGSSIKYGRNKLSKLPLLDLKQSLARKLPRRKLRLKEQFLTDLQRCLIMMMKQILISKLTEAIQYLHNFKILTFMSYILMCSSHCAENN